MNVCGTCLLDFGSLQAFDAHRVGAHRNGRRCLSPDALAGCGLALDARGRWPLLADAERARRRFGAAGVGQERLRGPELGPFLPECERGV